MTDRLISVFAPLAGLSAVLFSVSAAHGQSGTAPSVPPPAYHAPAPSTPPASGRPLPSVDGDAVGLPQWAAPQPPAPSFGGWRGSGVRMQASPALPSDPSKVPVDGGLGWLAAAGAAYALRRLQSPSPARET